MLYVTGDTHGDLDFQKILDWVQWYFGHYHKDMKLDNFSILYNRVERMKANGGSLF